MGVSFRRSGLLAAVLVLAAQAGCVDERIVYRDREIFSEPQTAAAGFVGYSDEADKLTVCGNCHVDKQSEWQETKHADAWATLQASGHAQAFCNDCHTVGPLGNPADAGGHAGVADSRYYDVQCESCHGPGLAHATTPDNAQPLAPMSVAASLTTGCAECHNGTHHPFVEEWSQSGHATYLASPAGRAECQECHTVGGIFAAWGINVRYTEAEDGTDIHGLTITCAVCHDPHANDNKGQLRFPADVPNEEQNLCMKCHHKRGRPDPTSSRGAHAPEGPVLLGDAGWLPPNFAFAPGEMVATHGSEANPKLCAGCHMNSFEVTDAEGGFVMNATGHLFQAIPCIDPATGVPTAGDCDMSERTFQSCTASGCHGSQNAARSAMFVVEERLADLAEELTALIAQIPATEFSTTDTQYTPGEGAKFNRDLIIFPGSGIHNPFLMEALATSTIDYIIEYYALTPVNAQLNLNNVLQD